MGFLGNNAQKMFKITSNADFFRCFLKKGLTEMRRAL